MAKKLINTADISLQEWQELRKKSIGGSDCATLLNLNKYKSPYSLWAEKTGRLTDEFTGNELTKQGTDLEDYVAKRFVQETGKKIRKSTFMYVHPDYEFITANIDRFVVGENAGLECKTTSIYNKADFENGEIPPYYYCQCMHYMAVMGFDKMYLAVLVLSKGFYWFEIKRDEKEIDALINSEVQFWNDNVISNTPPEIDGSESTFNTITSIFNDSELSAEVCNLSSEEETITTYQAIKSQIKFLQEEEKRLKNIIIEKLGNSIIGSTNEFQISYKPQTTNRVNSTALKKELPDIYNKFLTQTETKVLRITVKKGE